MISVIINGEEYIKKPAVQSTPEKIDGATHFAILPDDSIVYYQVADSVRIWLPNSKFWDLPGLVPYTLISFDD